MEQCLLYPMPRSLFLIKDPFGEVYYFDTQSTRTKGYLEMLKTRIPGVAFTVHVTNDKKEIEKLW